MRTNLLLAASSLLAAAGLVAAETGLDAWLRYAPLPLGIAPAALPSAIVALNSTQTSPVYTAGTELYNGIHSIFGKRLRVSHDDGPSFCTSSSFSSSYSSIVVGTVAAYGDNNNAVVNSSAATALEEDGYYLSVRGPQVVILGQNERGALHGAFAYLSLLAQGNFSDVEAAFSPVAPVRWVNQWDNLDGSIERGYGGASIFFANGVVIEDLTRAAQYARLLASVGLNAVIVNNVNANSSILSDENLAGLARIANVMRPYGVRIGISLDFASPQDFGGLSTYDPLDPGVIAWWANITDQLYAHVPDMAGFLAKADSEGQPGPLVYNRTLAQGANLFAKPLQQHNGVLMFRAFVYNDQLNESDWYADRANAAVQYFQGLDGEFEDNVVVQIKYGPIDFQVREPASPLFAHLQNTNTAIELEITQEYLGQQCHLVYLPPLWDTVLNFDLRVDGQPSLVRDIASGKRFNRPLGGSAGVVNVGTNATWLGSHLSMANLYAYGRLAWDTAQDPETILQEWIRLTFGGDQQVVDTITDMSMASWPAYRNYSGNLGVQTLTDILYTHFGPNPQSQDNNGWGQWTRADATSIGMDRTVSNGTGYAGQYPPEVYAVYENVSTTPDDLLLWFHHVNYTQLLHSGETVIQHFYNAHYAGAVTAQGFVPAWESLRGKIDDERYDEVLFRLVYQAGHSLVWRDAITNFYHNLSGIADTAGRVGSHPWRVEAESMTLQGYEPYTVSPFEAASNYTAIVTARNSSSAVGTATARLSFPAGEYDLGVNYYDLIGGRSRWSVFLNDWLVGEWVGNHEDTLGHAPSTYLDGHSASRVTFRGVWVQPGDELKIVGVPDGIEPAPLDYVVFLPAGVID